MKRTKKLIGNFVGTMVGIPLMGASATMANAMPAGMAKDLTGTAVGLQGVALVSHSLKGIDTSFGIQQPKRKKQKK
jgi:hypothetical protein